MEQTCAPAVVSLASCSSSPSSPSSPSSRPGEPPGASSRRHERTRAQGEAHVPSDHQSGEANPSSASQPRGAQRRSPALTGYSRQAAAIAKDIGWALGYTASSRCRDARENMHYWCDRILYSLLVDWGYTTEFFSVPLAASDPEATSYSAETERCSVFCRQDFPGDRPSDPITDGRGAGLIA